MHPNAVLIHRAPQAMQTPGVEVKTSSVAQNPASCRLEGTLEATSLLLLQMGNRDSVRLSQTIHLAGGRAGGTCRPSDSQAGPLSILPPKTRSICLEMLAPTFQT